MFSIRRSRTILLLLIALLYGILHVTYNLINFQPFKDYPIFETALNDTMLMEFSANNQMLEHTQPSQSLNDPNRSGYRTFKSLHIPHILHQSWKTTDLPAVSIEALTDRNSNDGERPGLTITPLGSTNYGQMKKIDSLFPSTIHGFSRLMMHCQKI
jgi:hypothetical protein